MTTSSDRETTLTHTDDLYAGFPQSLAALARDGEQRITDELTMKAKTRPAFALELDDTLHAYRKLAMALLSVVAQSHGTVVSEDVAVSYVRKQLDAECGVLLDNAEVRVSALLSDMGDTFRSYVARQVPSAKG